MASSRFAAELREELPKLVKDRVITKLQATRIAGRYASDHGSKIVGIIATFGAVLVALGVLTLVAMNWEDIPRAWRVAALFLATFGTAGAGHWLRSTNRFPRVGSSLVFLGCALFGVTLVLIAQMYHLSLSSGSWLLVWLVAIAPLAYLARSKSALALSLLVLSAWIAYRVSRLGDAGAWNEIEGVFRIWPLTVSIFLSYGAVLWGAADLHERYAVTRDFAATYRIVGAFLMLLNAYFLTYRWFTDGFWNATAFAALGTLPLLAVWVMAVIGAGAVAVKGRERTAVALAIGILSLGAAGIVTNPGFQGSSLFTPYSLIANIIMLALIVGTAALGIAWRARWLVNLAALFFAVDVVSRYFEFFSDRLSGGVFFIVTGVILILAAVAIEKARRAIIRIAEGG